MPARRTRPTGNHRRRRAEKLPLSRTCSVRRQAHGSHAQTRSLELTSRWPAWTRNKHGAVLFTPNTVACSSRQARAVLFTPVRPGLPLARNLLNLARQHETSRRVWAETGSRMSAGLLTTKESSDPLLCPYCRRQLRWATTHRQAHRVFECERCGEFPDFRVSQHERLPSEPSPPLETPPSS